MYFFQASKRPSTAPVDPSRRLSATEWKFGYADLLEEIGVPRFLVEDETDAVGDLSIVFVRCAVLPSLVANLPCTLSTCHLGLCRRKRTLSIRAVDRTLGMGCGLETFCTSCDKVINATLSSDYIDGTQARVCAASAGQHIGHERLLEQRLEMNPPMHLGRFRDFAVLQ